MNPLKRYVAIAYYDPRRGGSYTRVEEQFYNGREPEGQSRLYCLSEEVAELEKRLAELTATNTLPPSTASRTTE